MADTLIDTYRGFEIMRIDPVTEEGATIFWARATWDQCLTIYAGDVPTLRKSILDWWGGR